MFLPNHPKAQKVLEGLHADAREDAARWKARSGHADPTVNAAGTGELVRLGDFFLAVTPEAGRLLYILARARNAGRIVEFGASFGVSSIYLAAAAQDNGGELITTEVHPEKCIALRETFNRAVLDDHVTLLEGDALETLKDVSGPVDLLHLDGWKSGYLPIFELMRPKLTVGSLVLADNCFHEAASDYLQMVQAPESGCLTEIRDDLAISLILS